jgi:hypothetical protein
MKTLNVPIPDQQLRFSDQTFHFLVQPQSAILLTNYRAWLIHSPAPRPQERGDLACSDMGAEMHQKHRIFLLKMQAIVFKAYLGVAV